ncbi:MAG: PAS domain S-box protein [Alphaproteobacteria bacterium]|nr:PAS domain S-box protein [Alphaproteobacteria bacterium]
MAESIIKTGIEQQRLSQIVAIQRDVAHAHHDLQFAMNLIAVRTRDLTDADSSVIEILEGDEMVYRAASGRASAFIGMRIPAKGSLSGLCVKENTVLRCDDAETDDRVDKAACRKIGVTSMLVLPLKRGKQAIGVLKVLSSRKAAFNEQHVVMLEILAGVLSAAFSDALANAALREREELFRSSMEHSPLGMALVTPDGRWFKVNKALCRLLGYAEHELEKHDFREVTHPEDIPSCSRLLLQMLEGGMSDHEFQKRYLHKNGEPVWVQVYVSLVRNSEQKPLYFIVQIEDITARLRVEKLKNEFISVVSHELRTPLTSIHSSLGLLTNNVAGDLPEEANELVAVAYRNSQRLVLLINDILDIEKIESGTMTLRLEPLSVGGFLRSAIDMNRAYARKYGVKLVLGETVDAEVFADADRLMQVVTNLLSNAAKFSPEGGEVTLRTMRDNQCIRFEVEDTGCGIPEQFHAHIFDKFTQSDGSNTRKHEGTGLGLNITKQLVEMMGGSIGFTTAEDKGTTFHFTLPGV